MFLVQRYYFGYIGNQQDDHIDSVRERNAVIVTTDIMLQHGKEDEVKTTSTGSNCVYEK
jgi:hypothetical protein